MGRWEKQLPIEWKNIVFPRESILSLESRPLIQLVQVVYKEGKYSVSDIQGGIVGGATPLSIPWFSDLCILARRGTMLPICF
jgi:hypothetical protein